MRACSSRLSVGELLTLPGLVMGDIHCEAEPGAVSITTCLAGDSACCPDCQSRSWSVHSQSMRHPWDLPIQDKAVGLCLTVRRFFCRNEGCGRTTCVEQGPDFLRR
jgi:transposase